MIFSQVVQAEEKALMNLQQADFGDIINDLVEQGWFVKNGNEEMDEIWRDEDVLTMDKIKVNRRHHLNPEGRIKILSPDYPKIATKLMLDIMTEVGVNRNYNLDTYHADTIKEPYFQEFSKELIGKAWEKYQDYKTNKTQYFVGSDIVNNAQHTMTCYVDIKDQPLRHILYHDYLHWCSSMKRDSASLLLTYVSVPQINPQTNQFYRTVYQG
ncbi:hypothetical protein [Pelistega suis]|uniref:hypothetical protein n=1 Tax=Pelistega suis TaxID=1631957 RepID=UPI00211C3FD3|nr:hypothetical protein [Pelistega suis]MCQ9329017.1 hypothetical protein [Pelistega suis]